MKIDKIIILGIDACEYTLVEKWDLKNLKQQEYGKIKLPIDDKSYIYNEPATVIIWPCFITGYLPSENGILSIKTYNKTVKWFIDNIYAKFRVGAYFSSREKIESFNLKRWLLDTISKSFTKIGLARMPNRKDLKKDTFFNIPDIKSIHLHVPVYDNNAFPSYRGKEVKAIEDHNYRPLHEMLCIKEFKTRTKEVFDILNNNNEDWSIMMQYFFVLDSVQHVYYNSESKIAKFYIMFDEFVGKLNKMVDKNTLILIVSDHGQEKGIHTDYGFYSINKKLGLKEPKLTDFRWIIEKIIKGNYEKSNSNRA